MRTTSSRCPRHCPHRPFPIFIRDVSSWKAEVDALRNGVVAIREGTYPRPQGMPSRYYGCRNQAARKVRQLLELIANTPAPVRDAVCAASLPMQIGEAIGIAQPYIQHLDRMVMKHELKLKRFGIESLRTFTRQPAAPVTLAITFDHMPVKPAADRQRDRQAHVACSLIDAMSTSSLDGPSPRPAVRSSMTGQGDAQSNRVSVIRYAAGAHGVKAIGTA